MACIVAGTGWLALGACGLRAFGAAPLLDFCPVPPDPVDSADAATQLAALQARGDVLERDLHRLRVSLINVAPCPDPEPPAGAGIEAAVTPEPLQCPAEDPTEVIMVVDTSGSMQYNLNADPALERQRRRVVEQLNALDEAIARNPFVSITEGLRYNQLERELESLERRLTTGPGPDRMRVARDASLDLVDVLPPEVAISLMTFDDCTRHRRYGPFDDAERGSLRSRIRGLDATGGTPLAHTIRSVIDATAAGRSPDQPINVVVFSDGDDSCDGDPCAAAREVRSAMPYAPISVVAISADLDRLRCVADITGGLFLQPDSAARIGDAMRQAAGQDRPPGCP